VQSHRNGPRAGWRHLRRVPRLAAALALALPAAAFGEEPAEEPPPAPLDRLLKLPQGLELEDGAHRPGGASRSEWEARFQKARSELADAQDDLRETREELQELAGDTDSWQITAPGGLGAKPTHSDAPLDYQLSQKMRRQREAVERSEKNLHDLEIEANLAGVPEAWQRAGTEDASPSAP